MPNHDPIVVLGAGLAGLSLADALLDRGPPRPIVLVDRRRRWEQDRTWCTWLTGPLRFAELSGHRWARWRFASRGREVIRSSLAHPYIHIDGHDLYRHVLDRIDRSPDAQLRTGERVLGVTREAGGLMVVTSRETFTASTVVDAMGPAGPLRPPIRPAVALEQRFLGWEVESEQPMFDPTLATLMDLRGVQAGALAFFYGLAFTSRRALIEHTTIGVGGPDTAARRRALEQEVGRLAGRRAWRVVREERGVIPMTDATYPAPHGPGLYSLGAAAGAIRPSSGYAFTRTQRQVEALAAQLTGKPVRSEPLGAARRRGALDRIFLQAVSGSPDGGEELFWQLAAAAPADVFARFMADASSVPDELRIAAATPKWPALAALAAITTS